MNHVEELCNLAIDLADTYRHGFAGSLGRMIGTVELLSHGADPVTSRKVVAGELAWIAEVYTNRPNCVEERIEFLPFRAAAHLSEQLPAVTKEALQTENVRPLQELSLTICRLGGAHAHILLNTLRTIHQHPGYEDFEVYLRGRNIPIQPSREVF